jgi:hypothetical protein
MFHQLKIIKISMLLFVLILPNNEHYLPKQYFYLLNFFCTGVAQVTGHAALLSSYSGYTESTIISICTQKQ